MNSNSSEGTNFSWHGRWELSWNHELYWHSNFPRMTNGIVSDDKSIRAIDIQP